MKNGFPTADVFTPALGLNEPWAVRDVQLLPSEKNSEKLEMHITIDFKKRMHPRPWSTTTAGATSSSTSTI